MSTVQFVPVWVGSLSASLCFGVKLQLNAGFSSGGIPPVGAIDLLSDLGQLVSSCVGLFAPPTRHLHPHFRCPHPTPPRGIGGKTMKVSETEPKLCAVTSFSLLCLPKITHPSSRASSWAVCAPWPPDASAEYS